MADIDRQRVRHVLMRAGLGFVLAWFGVNELRSPSEWAVFVPSFVVDHSPVAVNNLILIHGALLVVAAAFIGLGLVYVIGCLLAMGLLAEILLGLWLDAGVSDLVIRDLGLLTLSVALALDPVRSWHFDNAVSEFPLASSMAPGGIRTAAAALSPLRLLGALIDMVFVGGAPSEPVISKRERSAQTSSQVARPYVAWVNRSAAGVLVIGTVALLAFLLGAGNNGVTLAGSAVAPLSASPVRSAPASGSSSSPAAASTQTTTSIRFDGWRYKQYAFQVYPGEISADAKKALAGFVLSIQDQGDNAVLSLKALNPRYRDAQFSVTKGDTAYFVETSVRDDPNGQENNLGDDGVIAVNPQGYVVTR